MIFDVQIFHDGSTKAFGVSLFPDLMDIHILFVLGYVCGWRCGFYVAGVTAFVLVK